MADAKITALTALTTVNGSDLLAIVDDPVGTPETKKITVDNLLVGSGGLVGVQVITATGAGTYTPTTGTTSIVIELVGGGGGGSGVASAAGSQVNLGGGGGGGGYVMKRLTADFSGAAYVVGALGGGGSSGNNNGTAGSDTTFTDTAGSPTVYTAGGGGGGAFRGSFAPPINSFVANGGTATNGDVNIRGGNGIPGQAPNTSVGWSAGGGASGKFFGPGAEPVDSGGAGTSVAGAAPLGGYGGGGSGAISTNSGGAKAGGNGANGILIIWEYR